ncbi:MAG: GxxExxY protein [Planctomycetota bacterium]
MIENEISHKVVSAAIEVHRTLGGPGLLESVYEEALAYELTELGCLVRRQVPSPIQYKDVTLATPLRIDLLVNDLVIVECKAITHYNSIFTTQLLTYLRLRKLKLGLVINFGERLVKDGIHRVVNDL